MALTTRCPTCCANIEISPTEIEYCPACKDRIKEKLQQLGIIGMTTATANGPNLKPIGDNLVQDVY